MRVTVDGVLSFKKHCLNTKMKIAARTVYYASLLAVCGASALTHCRHQQWHCAIQSRNMRIQYGLTVHVQNILTPHEMKAVALLQRMPIINTHRKNMRIFRYHSACN